MGRRRFDSITAGPLTNLSPAEDGQSNDTGQGWAWTHWCCGFLSPRTNSDTLPPCVCVQPREVSQVPSFSSTNPLAGMDCFPCLEPLRSACFIPVDSRHARFRPCGVRKGRPWLAGAGEEKRGEARQAACTQPGEADFRSSFRIAEVEQSMERLSPSLWLRTYGLTSRGMERGSVWHVYCCSPGKRTEDRGEGNVVSSSGVRLPRGPDVTASSVRGLYPSSVSRSKRACVGSRGAEG